MRDVRARARVCVWPILVWLIASTVVFISSQTRTLKLCIHIHIHAYMVGSLVSRQVEYSFAIGIYLYTEHASSHNAYLWRIGFWLHLFFFIIIIRTCGCRSVRVLVRRTHAAQATGRTRSECMGYIERAKTAFAISCFICCVCMCVYVCIFYRPANLDLTEPRRRIAW